MTTIIYQNYILWKGDGYLRLYRPAQPSRGIVLQRHSYIGLLFLLKIDSSFSIRPTCRSYCHNQAQQPPLNPQLNLVRQMCVLPSKGGLVHLFELLFHLIYWLCLNCKIDICLSVINGRTCTFCVIHFLVF